MEETILHKIVSSLDDNIKELEEALKKEQETSHKAYERQIFINGSLSFAKAFIVSLKEDFSDTVIKKSPNTKKNSKKNSVEV